MKNTKTVKSIIIFLMIILVILLVIFGMFYFNPSNRKLRYIYNTKIEGNIDMMPLNVSYAISDYKGGINQRSIYKALYMLVDEIIPKYHNLVGEINTIGASEYFKNNKTTISKELGITEEKDFISFIDEIKDLQGNDLVLEEYTFHPEGVSKKQKYLENILLIKYENNNKIALYIKIPKKENKEIFAIICSGGVNQKYLEYEYGSEFVDDESNELKKPENFVSSGRVIK